MAKKASSWFKKNIFTLVLSCLILFLSTGILLGLPHAVNFAASSVVSANNIPNNPAVLGVSMVITATPTPSPVPGPVSLGIAPPQVTATAALVVDLESGRKLFAKNPDLQVPIASTTKLMTALTAVNYYQLNDVLTVPYIDDIVGSKMGVVDGEKITFQNLLYGLMLPSGNDVAYTFARDYPGGEGAFIAAMNQNAKNWGLAHTHFDNPAGFDSPYHYSSAADLAVIATRAAENPILEKIFATKDITVTSVDGTKVHELHNLNKLLGHNGVVGMKTGTTPQAKENLIGLVIRQGHEVLTVVLGSDDRFGDTNSLMDWTYQNFQWR